MTSTIKQVIDKVCDMDRAQNSNNMIMGALQRALPKSPSSLVHNLPEPRPFKSGMHNENAFCVVLVTNTHNQPLWVQLFKSFGNTLRQIEPCNERRLDEEQFLRNERYGSDERFRYEENRRRDDYPRDRYDQEYSPDYDRHRGTKRRNGYYNQQRIITLNEGIIIGGTSATIKSRITDVPLVPEKHYQRVASFNRNQETGGSGVEDSRNTPSSDRKRRIKWSLEIVLLLLLTRRTLEQPMSGQRKDVVVTFSHYDEKITSSKLYELIQYL